MLLILWLTTTKHVRHELKLACVSTKHPIPNEHTLKQTKYYNATKVDTINNSKIKTALK